MYKINFEEVAKQALIRSQTLIATWLPGGTFSGNGNEYTVKNPTRNDQNEGSFVINTQTGVWSDFAADAEEKGMNLITLKAYIDGIKYETAAFELAAEFGMATDADRPDSHYRLGKPTKIYKYNDSFYIYRFETDTGKEMRPVTYNSFKWQWKAPEQRPLYNLDQIKSNPNNPILFSEGEKAADAAPIFFPNHISTTTSFGAKSPNKTDFSPVKNKDLLIWPDNDKAGKEYATKVAKLAIQAGAALVEILQIPNDKPAKFDADNCGKDDCPEQWKRIQFTVPKTKPKPTAPASPALNNKQSLSIIWETQDGKTRLLPSIDIALAIAPGLNNKLVYDDDVECWLYYKDNFWNITTPKRIFAYINEIIIANRRNVGYGPGLIKNVIEFLEGNRTLQFANFDDSKELIPLKNGILNINTMELYKHSPDYKFRYILPFKYDAQAKLSPTTIKFFDDTCGDDNGKRLLLQATLNRVIKGKRGIQMFTFLEGKPGTGKGIFLNLAQALVGNKNFHTTTLDRLAGKFEFSAIYGKKLVVVPDSKEYIEDLTPTNSLVSEDPLTLELKGQNFKMGQANNFKYGGWTIVAANGPIRGGGHKGKSRREIIIKFNTKPKKTDTQLFDKLTTPESLSGIFNWCMKLSDEEVVNIFMGMNELYPEGLTAKIENLLEADHYAHFLDENYELDDNHSFKLSVGKAQIEKTSKANFEGTTIYKDKVIGEDDWLSTTYLNYCVDYGIPQSKRIRTVRLSTKLMDTIAIFNLDVKRQRDKKSNFIDGLRPKGELGIFSQLMVGGKSISGGSKMEVNGGGKIGIKNGVVEVVEVDIYQKNSVLGHNDDMINGVAENKSGKITSTTSTTNKYVAFQPPSLPPPNLHSGGKNQLDDSLNLLLKVYGNSDSKRWNELTAIFSDKDIDDFINIGWLKELEDSSDLNPVLEFPLRLRRLAVKTGESGRA